jgi:hypothetical protein
MIRVLLWKEYRQQRSIWLTLAVLAILVWVALLGILGTNNSLQAGWLIAGITVAVFGLVSGALLTALEKEEGTSAFLDDLAGRRWRVWTIKLFAGFFFTSLLGLPLFALAAGAHMPHGDGEEPIALLMTLLGFEALIWGFLGGALCPSVLTGALAGLGLMALSYLLVLPLMALGPLLGLPTNDSTQAALLFKAIPDLAALAVARSKYCRTDWQRNPRRLSRAWLRLLIGWQVILWLAYRQGKWILYSAIGSTLLVGCLPGPLAVSVWPIWVMALGMACGLAVFCADQKSGHGFWAAQRMPLGRIWFTKVAAWGAVLAILSSIAWSMTALNISLSTLATSSTKSDVAGLQSKSLAVTQWWQGRLFPGLSPAMAGAFLAAYGFCFGLLFGLVVRRPVLALLLTALMTPLVVALWVPSLLIGDVVAWHVFVAPVLALTTTFFLMRPWTEGRLLSRGVIALLVSASLLMASSMAASFWYRAAAIPSIGEPFDVSTFKASFASRRNLAAGSLLERAESEMRLSVIDAQKQMDRPLEGRDGQQLTAQLGALLNKRWETKDHDLGNCLDKIFAGSWAQDAQKAASIPDGVLRSALLATNTFGEEWENGIELELIFLLRALQLQERGEAQEALNQIDTALAICRLRERDAPALTYSKVSNIDSMLILHQAFYRWLMAIPPDRALLQAAQGVLKRHELLHPDPARSIESEYLLEFVDNPAATQFNELQKLALFAPWERERRRRIVNLMTQAAIATVNAFPLPDVPTALQGIPGLERLNPLPVIFSRRNVPGDALTIDEWSTWIMEQAPLTYARYWNVRSAYALATQRLRAAQTAVAVRLYQEDHGRLPAQIQDLVPTYLAKIPIDPFTNAPLAYSIEEREEVLVPLCLASAWGFMSMPDGLGPLQVASTLHSRYITLFSTPDVPAGGPPSGFGLSGGVAGPPLGEVPVADELVPLPPLAPQAVIGSGLAAYTVPFRRSK